jgi:OOP family OmpA-OmpF porin
MSNVTKITTAALAALISLNACKRDDATTAETTAASTTSTADSTRARSQATPIGNPASSSAVTPFDLQSVPITSTKLPAFPYVDRPAGTEGYHNEEQQFDQIYVIAGNELRSVEGRYQQRWFPLSVVKMSLLEAYRNYDSAFRALGAVRVDAVGPADPVFVARNGDTKSILQRLRLPNLPGDLPGDVPVYAQYLLRAPDRNIWLSFSVFDDGLNVSVTTLEEKPMQQRVSFIKADEMWNALGKDGHVALYINFDTDKAGIRPDGKLAVDEIAKLLDKNPSLNLTIEGHTDNVGDPAHNKTLSQQRADAVMGSLIATGIAKERLSTLGLGDTKPVADNNDDTGRAKNRRVELVKRT